MADEIRITAGMSLENGLLKISVPATTIKVDQATGRGGGPGVQDIGTTEETLSFGDIVPGYVYMKNLDATNFVTWGFTTGQLGAKMLAGGAPTLVNVGTGSLILKADTSACKVQIIAFNI